MLKQIHGAAVSKASSGFLLIAKGIHSPTSQSSMHSWLRPIASAAKFDMQKCAKSHRPVVDAKLAEALSQGCHV